MDDEVWRHPHGISTGVHGQSSTRMDVWIKKNCRTLPVCHTCQQRHIGRRLMTEERTMSDDTESIEPTLATLADQLMHLAAEHALLRESIVTAAEWDNQARQMRQGELDATLHSVRRWTQILIGMVAVLLVVVLILVGLVIILLLGLSGA